MRKKTYRGKAIKIPVERVLRLERYDLKHFPAGEGTVDLGHGYTGVVRPPEGDLRRIRVDGPRLRAETSVRIVRKPFGGGRFLCPWLLCPECGRGVKILVLSTEMTWHCITCGNLTWQSHQRSRLRPVTRVKSPKMPSWRYRSLLARGVGSAVPNEERFLWDAMNLQEYEARYFAPHHPGADLVRKFLPERYWAVLNEDLRRQRSKAHRSLAHIRPLSPEEEKQLLQEEMRRRDPGWRPRGLHQRIRTFSSTPK